MKPDYSCLATGFLVLFTMTFSCGVMLLFTHNADRTGLFCAGIGFLGAVFFAPTALYREP